MSQHDVSKDPQFNEQESEENSRVDAVAILSLVAIVVILTVYYVSR